jgi:hypothetical protein
MATDELVKHVARDLRDRRTAAAHRSRVKPWISGLSADGGTVVGAVGSRKRAAAFAGRRSLEF